MDRINLQEYNSYLAYFTLFDIYFKENDIKKEEFLSKIGVTPSSYRKCRTGSLKIGEAVVEQVARELGYKVPSKELIEEFQDKANKIYYDIYYKVYDNYDNYLIYLEDLLKEKYLIEPIIILFKLFLITNSNKSFKTVRTTNKESFEEVKKYKKIFNDGLLEIFEIVLLANEETIDYEYLVKQYDSALPYYTLSTRSFLEYNYIQCLYFVDKAKELLHRDNNINRLYYLNNTAMNCLLEIGNYQECLDIAKKQLLSLDSVGLENDFIKFHCNKNKVLALLGLKKYKQVIDIVESRDKVAKIEVMALIVAGKMFDKANNTNISKQIYDDIIESEFDEKFMKYANLLIEYLDNPNEKLLNKIKEYDFTSRCFTFILKNIEIE